MQPEIAVYNEQFEPAHKELCDLPAEEIDKALA